MKKIAMHSIRLKLVALFLALSVVPLLAVGVITFRSSEKALKEEALAKLKAVGESREKHIIDYIGGQFEVLIALANDHFFQEISNSNFKNEELQRVLDEAAVSLPSFYEIFVMNKNGNIVASSDKENIGLDKATDSYFTGAIGGKRFLKDVYASMTTGQTGFVISVPIFSHAREEIVGVLAGRAKLDTLNKITKNSAGMGNTGEVYIVNNRGSVITGSRLRGDEVILRDKALSVGVQQALSAEENVGLFVNYMGKQVLGYYSGRDFRDNFGKNWVIVAEIDRDEAFAPAIDLRNIMILVIVITMMIVIAVGILISNNIANPIVNLSGVAREVASGDLTKSLEVKSRDEIGLLAESFNSMIGGLTGILAKIQDAVNQITSAGNEILSASQEQAASAREQSSAVSETTSAASELSKSAEAVGESIKRVTQAANHALVGMAKIKETMTKTSQIVSSLNEKSQKIGQITDLIDDVADQTNLLAVNASIEAARAGEEGRGFTVVADEIRKLADSTAKSTKDITALIELIQNEMSNAIMSMEQNMSGVEEEAQMAKETAEQSKEIAMSATQQVSGSKQIAEAMSSVNEAMKQISTGAQQSQVAAKQLTHLSGELKAAVEKFKLPQRESGDNK